MRVNEGQLLLLSKRKFLGNSDMMSFCLLSKEQISKISRKKLFLSSEILFEPPKNYHLEQLRVFKKEKKGSHSHVNVKHT